MVTEQLESCEKPVTVYAARCFSNAKVYVGITTNFRTRKVKHKADSDKDSGHLFHRAIRKYGWDDFEWCVIETSPTRAAANEIERYWINYFKSNNRAFGYNMTEGGEGAKGRVHSEESKRRMSEAAKGRTFSEETRRKMSESRKRQPISEETRKKLSEAQKARSPESYDFLRGKPLSDETKRKLSEAATGVVRSEETRRKISETLKAKARNKQSLESQVESDDG